MPINARSMRDQSTNFYRRFPEVPKVNSVPQDQFQPDFHVRPWDELNQGACKEDLGVLWAEACERIMSMGEESHGYRVHASEGAGA